MSRADFMSVANRVGTGVQCGSEGMGQQFTGRVCREGAVIQQAQEMSSVGGHCLHGRDLAMVSS